MRLVGSTILQVIIYRQPWSVLETLRAGCFMFDLCMACTMEIFSERWAACWVPRLPGVLFLYVLLCTHRTAVLYTSFQIIWSGD